MKKILLYLLVLLVLLTVAFAFITRTSPGIAGSVAGDADLVARGAYVARLADCAACHTAVRGKAYAGGLQIESPIGTIFSTNITPDKADGIGNYSLADFDRAVRQGVRKDGSSLYPAMPYPSFARMSDADITALYAFMQHGVAPVAAPDQAEQIRWPLSMRWPLALWRGLFAPKVAAAVPAARMDPIVARGEYLVTGPGHCGSCHTPRGAAIQEQALDDRSDEKRFLAGGTVIDGWVVPSLRGDDVDGLGRWSTSDIVTFLKTGRIDHSAVFGGMADVVTWSTQHYADEDLNAMAKYLKTLSPVTSAKYAYDATATALLDNGKVDGNNGAKVYLQQCSLCHRNDGGGVARMFPPLAGNPVVTSKNPISLLHVVALGGTLPPSNWAPSSVAMPAYGTHLSDQDMADVVNFIRRSWGNRATANATAQMVSPWREQALTPGGTDASGWSLATPQPYGEDWSFAPQTHSGNDAAQ